MTGSIPLGNYIVVPVLAGDATVLQGRSYAVYLPDNGQSDPNSGVRMYLEAVDRPRGSQSSSCVEHSADAGALNAAHRCGAASAP